MRSILPGAILCALSTRPCPAAPPEAIPSLPKPQADYLLNCGGCHGLNGVSNGRLVPDLQSQVGYFLRIHEGREYLVRLPNVAFSAMSDAGTRRRAQFHRLPDGRQRLSRRRRPVQRGGGRGAATAPAQRGQPHRVPRPAGRDANTPIWGAGGSAKLRKRRPLGAAVTFGRRRLKSVYCAFIWGRPVSTWVAKLQVRTEVQVTSLN